MKVGIIGGGVEGQSAIRYWQAQGADVTLHDVSTTITVPEGVKSVLGPGYLKDLNQYDLVVRSPGVKPKEVKTKVPKTTVIREFFKHCPAKIIGVTGTKGKGTTASLIAKILEEGGKKVWLGGNIGQSPLDFLPRVKPTDIVVLELSSFQLMDLDVSPQVAVCLMVVPEHMDWHSNLREYLGAKGNIFWHQRKGDVAIYNSRNDYSTQIAQLSPGRKVPFMKAPGAEVIDGVVKIGDHEICPVGEVGLVGPHNLENICAAVTAAGEILGDDTRAAARAVRDFKGLDNRLEHVADVDGVSYYNDSFSTTPETAMAALAAFDAPKVIILGGSSKNSKYEQLGEAVAKGNVREVVLVGETGPNIKAALKAAGYDRIRDGGRTMAEMVAVAKAAAKPGDVVVLSPASASFDLFRNYKDRGEQFRAAVMLEAKT